MFSFTLGLLVQDLTEMHNIFLTHNGFHEQLGNNDIIYCSFNINIHLFQFSFSEIRFEYYVVYRFVQICYQIIKR